MLVSSKVVACNHEMDAPLRKTEPTQYAERIMEKMQDGFRLFKDRQDFSWYLKKQGETPFISITISLYKPTVTNLLATGKIVLAKKATYRTDPEYTIAAVSNGN